MSCDGNRHKYFEQLGQRADIQQALGLDAAGCAQALERLYQVGNSMGAIKSVAQPDSLELTLETERTRDLFARMSALGLKPPAHSADGLPRKTARWGYGQVERALKAIEKGDKIPDRLSSIISKMSGGKVIASPRVGLDVNRNGSLSALGFDEGGYYRCANCGRFASQTNGHVCPMTATSKDLSRMLQRRLGLPASALDESEIEKLIGQAKNGDIEMVHSLTGRVERVTLDGIPQAMMSGFSPKEWGNKSVPVVVGDFVISVLNADGLTRAAENIGAIQSIAQSYGLSIASDSRVMSAHLALQQNLQQVQLQREQPGTNQQDKRDDTTMFTLKTSSFNARRYGKPWIATVKFGADGKTEYEWGNWVGTVDGGDGSAGELVINAREGDIVADGMRDYRKGTSNITYYQVKNGQLVELKGGKAEAFRLWKERTQAKQGTRLSNDERPDEQKAQPIQQLTTFTLKTSSFNARRYGKPWIATVKFGADGKTDYEWGNWVGTVDGGDGSAGELVINAREGDIVADGMRDRRKGTSNITYYQVKNGQLVELKGGKSEAFRLWKEKTQAK